MVEEKSRTLNESETFLRQIFGTKNDENEEEDREKDESEVRGAEEEDDKENEEGEPRKANEDGRPNPGKTADSNHEIYIISIIIVQWIILLKI